MGQANAVEIQGPGQVGIGLGQVCIGLHLAFQGLVGSFFLLLHAL
jgi:hypothetical protein